ncbi:MAG: HlyD family secretion protein, partial [Candidatus Krumholzibacteriia bacterium]
MERMRIFGRHRGAIVAWSALPVLLAAAGCGARRDANLIVAAGHVEATEVQVATKVGGTVVALEAQEGDRVAAGARIARLDTVDLALARRGALAERALADANLRLRLDGSRREDVAEAAAGVAKAESDFATADKDLARFQGLQDAGSGTERSLDDARNRRAAAAAALEVARQRLGRLRAGFRPEEIDAARAQAAAAAARVAQLDQQIDDAVVVSPVSGIVTARPVVRGELL